MLAQRIIDTLRFFDLQSLPLTASEIHKYLITESAALRNKLDHRYELLDTHLLDPASVHQDTILTQLHILSREGKIITAKGLYALPGRESIIQDRLGNYFHGLKREKLVRRYLKPARHIPFVRGAALAGSQALGQQRQSSDIDLLIITDPEFMWTARTLMSIWFQLFGVRRHGNKIANRFCLNHYLANPREVDSERNLYKAMEYVKLRPVIHAAGIEQFQKANERWIRQFFPNVYFAEPREHAPSPVQHWGEKVLRTAVGRWLERRLGKWQQQRIHQDQFVFVRDDELSFHPESKHESLLKGFFEERMANKKAET